MNFIIALGQCVLAGAFASWYWAWDKKTVRQLSTLRFKRCYNIPGAWLLNRPPVPAMDLKSSRQACDVTC